MTTGNSFTLYRRISNTNYTVTVYLSDTATETYEGKILRLLCHELPEHHKKDSIIDFPQTTRQSDRIA